MFNETSTNITTSSEMDNNMIAANEIAMKKVMAMKTDDDKDIVVKAQDMLIKKYLEGVDLILNEYTQKIDFRSNYIESCNKGI